MDLTGEELRIDKLFQLHKGIIMLKKDVTLSNGVHVSNALLNIETVTTYKNNEMSYTVSCRTSEEMSPFHTFTFHCQYKGGVAFDECEKDLFIREL